MATIVYQSPSSPSALDACFFYHCLDLPGYGEILGQWDLRPAVELYLGGVDLAGRRVFELGPASGYLTFHMEQAGAEVVGCELATGDDWDLVPYAEDPERHDYVATRRMLQAKLRDGYWLAHAAHGSRAGVCYASVYQLPESIGRFDVATFGMVLLHLRDPFQALATVLRHVDGTAIVTEMFPWPFASPALAESFSSRPGEASAAGRVELSKEHLQEISRWSPRTFFCPQADIRQPKETWWHFTPSWVCEALKVLGFDIDSVSYHYQFHDPAYQWTSTPDAEPRLHACYTVVGRRVRAAV